jgi:ketosteroid isomerase-like protein
MRTVLAVLLLALPLSAATSEDEIRTVLEDQTAAWNRGDIPAFMAGYLESESTTFVSDTVTRGHAKVLARYLQRYPTHEKMGTLHFSGVEVKLLGTGYASVLGRFHLTRAAEAGGDATGLFTLLFQKTPAGWKVILDHTS